MRCLDEDRPRTLANELVVGRQAGLTPVMFSASLYPDEAPKETIRPRGKRGRKSPLYDF